MSHTLVYAGTVNSRQEMVRIKRKENAWTLLVENVNLSNYYEKHYVYVFKIKT